MASPYTSTAWPIGRTAFRASDGTEIVLRSDGVALRREPGRKLWREAGSWPIHSPETVRELRKRGYTEHHIDEDGDVIR